MQTNILHGFPDFYPIGHQYICFFNEEIFSMQKEVQNNVRKISKATLKLASI